MLKSSIFSDNSIDRFPTWRTSSTTEQNDANEQFSSNIYSALVSPQRNNSESEIPSYVECPITCQIYRHPMMLVEAQMVFEEAIIANLTSCPIGPNIGKKLRSKTYFPDIGTQQAVEAYLKRHPEKDNTEDRYQEYPSSFSGKKTVIPEVLDENDKSDFCYKQFCCSNKFCGVLLFTFIGGLVVQGCPILNFDAPFSRLREKGRG